MNFEFFIAKKLLASRRMKKPDALPGPAENGFNGSRPVIAIATLGITLGIAVMIIAVSIVSGFKSEIRDKVIGFGAHIQITNYDANASYEHTPVDKNQPFYPYLDTVPGIRHIQVFATKAGIIKANDEIQGVVVKGIGSDFDWSFFQNNIIEGRNFVVSDEVKSNDIIISKTIATRLKLKTGDDLLMYFIQQPPRMRKFKIAGIYETGLEEFDKLYVLADIAHIQKLNDWNSNQVGGFEVLINHFDDLEELGNKVYYKIIGYNLYAQTIREANPQIFDWLDLQNLNVQIILALMTLVAAINMISALLVLILEKTRFIGILKALGAQSWSIRRIFLYIAARLIGTGLFWGNLLGLGLCLMQIKFGIFTLDQSSYYISLVPVKINLLQILMLNAGALVFCILMLIAPTYVITRIEPVKAISFV